MRRKVYVPFFEKDGNEFFFIGWQADSESDAQLIAVREVETTTMLGAKYIGVRKIDPQRTPYVQAYIGSYTVAVTSGPIFKQNKK